MNVGRPQVEAVETPEPIGGPGGVEVGEGDCVSSIADATGFFWETLWNHARNTALKNARTDPNVLLPGDRVFVPKLVPARSERATGARHRFRRRGVPEILRMHIHDDEGKPRKSLAYRLKVGGRVLEGRTNAEGYLEQWVPPEAKRGELELISPSDPNIVESTLELEIGSLQPAGTLEGAAARLTALGFYSREDDDETSVRFHQALYRFQQIFGLTVSGELDASTRDALTSAYGS